MQGRPIKLSECIDSYVGNWFDEYRDLAESGNLEGMIIYAQLLKRGSKSIRSDINQSIYWLKKACKSSPEAAFRLGLMYKTGKHINTDIEKSYFYFRVSMLFKCKCGSQANEYHNNLVSNVHPCYPFEAEKLISTLDLSASLKKRCEDHFNTWMKNNLR